MEEAVRKISQREMERKKRVEGWTRVGAYGPLAPQFFRAQPSETSDLRERILSGDYFKATDE